MLSLSKASLYTGLDPSAVYRGQIWAIGFSPEASSIIERIISSIFIIINSPYYIFINTTDIGKKKIESRTLVVPV